MGEVLEVTRIFTSIGMLFPASAEAHGTYPISPGGAADAHEGELRACLRQLLNVAFRPEVGIGQSGSTTFYRDVFCSEKAIAMLLCWHLDQPEQVAHQGASTPPVEQLLTRILPENLRRSDPAQWARDYQQQIVDGLLADAGDPLRGKLDAIYQWPGLPAPTAAAPAGLPLSTAPLPADTLGLLAGADDRPVAVLPEAAEAVPADVTHAAAQGYPVVVGLSKGKEVFRIVSRETQNSTNYEFHRINSVTGTASNDIDCFQLYAFNTSESSTEPEPVWETAVCPGTDITVAIATNLQIDFSIRTFFQPVPATVSNPKLSKLPVTIWLKHQTDDGPAWLIDQMSLDIKLFNSVQNVSLNNLDSAYFEVQTASPPNNYGFARPPVADVLGYIMPGQIHPQICGFDMKSYATFTKKGTDNKTPSFYFEYVIDLQLKKETVHQLRPTGAFANTADFPDNGNTHLVTFRQRPPLDEQEKATGAQWILETTVPHTAVLDWWNKHIPPKLLTAISTVEAGRNATFIPMWQNSMLCNSKELWQASYLVFDHCRKTGELVAHQDIVIGPTEKSVIDQAKITLYLQTLTPKQPEERPGQPKKELEQKHVQATFPGLRIYGDKGPHSCHYLIKSETPSAVEKTLTEFQLYFRLATQLPQSLKDEKRYLRLQGIDLQLPEEDKPAVDQTMIADSTIDFILQMTSADTFDIREGNADLTLGALAFSAGDQDDLPGEELIPEGSPERSPNPIVIPVPATDTKAEIQPLLPYHLVAKELLTATSSHHITLQLMQPAPTLVSTDVLVIDPSPLSVVRVVAQDIGTRQQLDLTELGNWGPRAGEGANWSVNFAGEVFTLYLPPQGIGETMHRYRDAYDLEEKTPAAGMRFGPPARLDIFSTETGTLFSELPWDIRRRLGYPGQRLPGALLQRLTVEPVYGIQCELETTSLRLAELQARLGNLPPALPEKLYWMADEGQSTNFDRYKKVIPGLLQAVRTRIAVYEPYLPQPTVALSSPAGGAVAADTLVLTPKDGLHVRLRRDANLAYPVPGVEVPDDAPNGALKGSFAWAFESAVLYNALWSNIEAVDAKLTALRLSPVGGWGHLRAAFNGGNTVIDATVSLGRVERLAIEQRGRINRVWNRARHVIVYERTTAASLQFAGDQYPFIGSPILRKTEEYVEIEERERSVIDERTTKAADQAQAAGFVQACRFPNGDPPRIHVSSRWGSDVGDFGWKVPLWMRNAAPAEVYPKPDIRLLCSSDRHEPEACPIEDPEKLYFYTQVGDEHPDPDTWGAVLTVDYDPLPASALAPQINAAAIEPGTGAGTFTLGPSRAFNLIAGRQQRTVATRLATITLQRGPVTLLSETGQATKILSDIHAALDHAANAILPVRALLSWDPAKAMQPISRRIPGKPEVTETLEDYCERLSAGYDKLRSALQTSINALPVVDNKLDMESVICVQLQRLYQTSWRQIEADVAGVFTEMSRKIESDEQLQHIVDQATALDDNLRKQLKDCLDTILDTFAPNTAFNTIHGLSGELHKIYIDARAAIRRLYDNTNTTLTNTRTEIQQYLAAGQIEKANAALRRTALMLQDAAAAMETQLASVLRRWLGRCPSNIDLQPWLRLRNAIMQLGYAYRADPNHWDVTQYQEAVDALQAYKDSLLNKLDAVKLSVIDKLPIVQFDTAVNGYRTQLLNAVDSAVTAAQDLAQFKERRLLLAELKKATFTFLSDQLAQELAQYQQLLIKTVIPEEAGLAVQHVIIEKDKLVTHFQSIFASTRLKTMEDILKTVSTADKLIGDDFRLYCDDLLAEASASTAGMVYYAESVLGKELKPVISNADTLLKTVRAFGEAPVVPGMDFTSGDVLSGVAYSFFKKEIKQPEIALANVLMSKLQMTAGQPARAAVEELKKALVPVTLSFPTGVISDVFKPDLSNLSISDIFANLAGMPLKGLFAGAGLPDIAGDRIKVRHEVDPQTRSGRVHIDADVPLDKPVSLFALAGLSLTLKLARLRAMVDIAVQAGAPPQTRAEGSIFGDWELQVGGFQIVSLNRTTLTFNESGKVRFDIRPDSLQLQQVLAFLSDAMKKAGYSDSGLSFRVTGKSVESVLSLPLPDVQAGAFGMANLNLGFRFGLGMDDQKGFALSTGLLVGRQNAPFTLTVFILGGAGWFDLSFNYFPTSREFSADVSLAIMASASLAIAFGPIKGGVYAYFGLTVEYHASQGAPNGLCVGIVLMFVGTVSLLGLVEVGMALQLQAKYESGGGLVGHGCVSYKIKIGWFLNISVSAQVTYRFGSAAGKKQLASPHTLALADLSEATDDHFYEDYARDYFNMFA